MFQQRKEKYKHANILPATRLLLLQKDQNSTHCNSTQIKKELKLQWLIQMSKSSCDN
jgi:hypothetical protein